MLESLVLKDCQFWLTIKVQVLLWRLLPMLKGEILVVVAVWEARKSQEIGTELKDTLYIFW